MAAVAALLTSRRAIQALRRGLPRPAHRAVICRNAAALRRLLSLRLVDAIVLAPDPPALADLDRLRADYPALPVVAYAPFRPDDGALLVACRKVAVDAVLVEGVDDAVVGDLVARHSLSAARGRALADAPRLLRLRDPLQRSVWDRLLARVERPLRTAALARELGVSREHLSRQFGAGGAPNLKRVIDLTRVATAAQLLRNPGCRLASAVELLGFASARHLAGTSRRIAGVAPGELGALGPGGVLAAFVRGHTRSRR